MAQERSPDGTDSEEAENEEEQAEKDKEEDEENKTEEKGDDDEEVSLVNNRQKQVTGGTAQRTGAPGKPPMARRSAGSLPKDPKAVPKDKAARIPRKKKPKS